MRLFSFKLRRTSIGQNKGSAIIPVACCHNFGVALLGDQGWRQEFFNGEAVISDEGAKIRVLGHCKCQKIVFHFPMGD